MIVMIVMMMMVMVMIMMTIIYLQHITMLVLYVYTVCVDSPGDSSSESDFHQSVSGVLLKLEHEAADSEFFRNKGTY